MIFYLTGRRWKRGFAETSISITDTDMAFSIILKKKGILISDCGLEHIEVDGKAEVELGYDIRSGYWGKGYATEAGNTVRDYTFTDIGLERLISLIRPTNAASIRVAEKIGMIEEHGIERSGHLYYIYSMNREHI